MDNEGREAVSISDFRHAYSFGLDIERVLLLIRKVLDSQSLLLGELKRFEARIAEFDLEP